MDDALFAARRLLEEVTPLKGDCGRICGAACCNSLEGEETGMLLFPGEEVLYQDRPGWRLKKTETGETLVICPGRCDRRDRPLSCRIFPLLPLLREESIRVETDLRARAVCPLARRGRGTMDPAFIGAVKEAGILLAEETAQRAFLNRLEEEQQQLRLLRSTWEGRS